MHRKTSTVPDSVSRQGLAFVEECGHRGRQRKEKQINLDAMMMQLGVEWTVRLHEDDFHSAIHVMVKGRGRFSHFNLGGTIHQPGKKYALVPILRPGNKQKPPLVDYRKATIVLCDRVLSEMPYSAYAEYDYRDSLPSIQSQSDLEREMCRRYCAVRGMTEIEVLATSVTLTEFSRY